jgi:hypothetical protein
MIVNFAQQYALVMDGPFLLKMESALQYVEIK